MHTKRRMLAGLIASAGMLLLILDANTAINGAKEGMELCLFTLIPSLFPFVFLSILICNNLGGMQFRFLRPLGKLCGIPAGSESLLLLSFLGGYPVGAQSVAEAWKNKQLSRQDAERMLGFCNNAGPAFLFGVIGSAFTVPEAPWLLWAIHILSAILTALLLPRHSTDVFQSVPNRKASVFGALEKALKSVALICGWVILFRVVIAVCSRWFFWLMPQSVQVLIAGLLELANGCATLYTIPSEGMRFVIGCCLINFGGFCVGMQTESVTGKLGSGMYFPGKLLQGGISCMIAILVQNFLYPWDCVSVSPLIWFGMILILSVTVLFVRSKWLTEKKVVAFSA